MVTVVTGTKPEAHLLLSLAPPQEISIFKSQAFRAGRNLPELILCVVAMRRGPGHDRGILSHAHSVGGGLPDSSDSQLQLSIGLAETSLDFMAV